jgi:hypothetical protein
LYVEHGRDMGPDYPRPKSFNDFIGLKAFRFHALRAFDAFEHVQNSQVQRPLSH